MWFYLITIWWVFRGGKHGFISLSWFKGICCGTVVYVCYLIKNLKLGGQGGERIWKDLGEGKNMIKIYLNLNIFNNKNIIKETT